MKDFMIKNGDKVDCTLITMAQEVLTDIAPLEIKDEEVEVIVQEIENGIED
jgi:hypothetical protein